MGLSQKMKRVLKYLGQPYEVKVIDAEDCIYRNLGNGFDIEVSGVDYCNHRSSVCAFVCVWDVRKNMGYGARTVEYVRYPKTLEDLKRVLEGLTEKYSGPNPPTVDADSYADEWLRQRGA